MNIAVFCGSSCGNGPRYVEAARTLGRWIGENGHTLVYGGANKGIMGEVADAVLKAKGKVIGVLPRIMLIQERKHLGLTEYIETSSMAERKTRMIELADAFVALPGGIGTLDEITEVMTLASLGIIKDPIVLYDAGGYYQPLKGVLENIVNKEFGRKEYFSNVLISDDILKIAKHLT
ncbi:MAG: TIGR00730 family Rossman fold protein [Lachnospiraceae bacterium]|nr:TIGR00730 family Rossman fold protein [Lachnospiraceae bacterium]